MSNIKLVYDAFGRPHPVKEEEMFEYGLDINGDPSGGAPTGLEFRLLGTVTYADLNEGPVLLNVDANEIILSHGIATTTYFDNITPASAIASPTSFGNTLSVHNINTKGTRAWLPDTYYDGTGTTQYLAAGNAIWSIDSPRTSGPGWQDAEHTIPVTGPVAIGFTPTITSAGTGYALGHYCTSSGDHGRDGVIIEVTEVDGNGGIVACTVAFGGNGFITGYSYSLTVQGGEGGVVQVTSAAPIEVAIVDTIAAFADAYAAYYALSPTGTLTIGDGGATWTFYTDGNTVGECDVWGLVGTAV